MCFTAVSGTAIRALIRKLAVIQLLSCTVQCGSSPCFCVNEGHSAHSSVLPLVPHVGRHETRVGQTIKSRYSVMQDRKPNSNGK